MNRTYRYAVRAPRLSHVCLFRPPGEGTNKYAHRAGPCCHVHADPRAQGSKTPRHAPPSALLASCAPPLLCTSRGPRTPHSTAVAPSTAEEISFQVVQNVNRCFYFLKRKKASETFRHIKNPDYTRLSLLPTYSKCHAMLGARSAARAAAQGAIMHGRHATTCSAAQRRWVLEGRASHRREEPGAPAARVTSPIRLPQGARHTGGMMERQHARPMLPISLTVAEVTAIGSILQKLVD